MLISPQLSLLSFTATFIICHWLYYITMQVAAPLQKRSGFLTYILHHTVTAKPRNWLNPNSTNLPELRDLPRGGGISPPILFQKVVV